MHIKRTSEQNELVENLVAQGRFSSPSKVVSASLTLIQADEEWRKFAQQCIDAGVDAAKAGNFAPEAELDTPSSKYQRKTA